MSLIPESEFNEAALNIRIARYTSQLSTRFLLSTAHDRTVLNTAIGILTQALILSQTSPADAQRLFSNAVKVASMVHGK